MVVGGKCKYSFSIDDLTIGSDGEERVLVLKPTDQRDVTSAFLLKSDEFVSELHGLMPGVWYHPDPGPTASVEEKKASLRRQLEALG